MNADERRQLLLSIPAGHIDSAAPINLDVELKLDWEDFDLLIRDRI